MQLKTFVCCLVWAANPPLMMINLLVADQVGGRSPSVRRPAVSERRTVPLQPADSGHRPAHLQQPGGDPASGFINGLLTRCLKIHIKSLRPVLRALASTTSSP